jgi:hypothetical protein
MTHRVDADAREASPFPCPRIALAASIPQKGVHKAPSAGPFVVVASAKSEKTV